MFSKNPLINLLKYTWDYSFGTKKMVVLFIVLSVIGNIVWLFEVVIVGRIFNEIQFSSQKTDPLLFIAYNMGLLVAVTFIGWLFHGSSRIIENRNAFLVRKNYRQTMFEHVMELPVKWHKDHHSGDTIDKINKASENLFVFSSEMFTIIQNVTAFVGSVVILALYDVKPVFIAMFTSVVVIFVILKFDTKLIKLYKENFRRENFIASGIYDYISNYITIISLRLKKSAAKEIEQRSMKPYGIFVKSIVINEAKWFISSMIIAIMTATVVFFNAYTSYKTQGIIVIGTLFVLYQYLHNIGNAFYTFAWKYSEIVRQNTAVIAAEIINKEYEKLHLEKKYILPQDWKTIQIKNINFAYKNEDSVKPEAYTISNVSLNIGNNKKVALIGTSGSGKSTILSLLRGLHETNSVKVYCDGKKLENGLKHFFDYCTLVPQEPEIFNDTIEYNITMGVHIDRKHLEKVLEISNLKDLISRLKQGLRTSVLEKGVSLSGGEKQRLALARGLLAAKDSQFLLLDESTSSVDVENEYQIYQNIFKNFSDKVIISAVHGLHLLKHFDYIYMFKDSKVIAEGNFSMLLEDENFKVLWENYKTEHEENNN